jgi:hypothetical protein
MLQLNRFSVTTAGDARLESTYPSSLNRWAKEAGLLLGHFF